jgi:acetoin utilization protein AcuB
MLIPPVARYMTPNPISVAPNEKLGSVREMMRQHRVHHLPVVKDRKLVGILSDRDLAMMNAYGDRVADAMTREVTTVTRHTPIDEVVTIMEAKRIASVVIVGDDGAEGIFTSTDALRALRDVIQRMEASDR